MFRYSKSEREQLLAEWDGQGTSAAEFCRWKKAGAAGASVPFVKIKPFAPNEVPGNGTLTLEKGGWRITVISPRGGNLGPTSEDLSATIPAEIPVF